MNGAETSPVRIFATPGSTAASQQLLLPAHSLQKPCECLVMVGPDPTAVLPMSPFSSPSSSPLCGHHGWLLLALPWQHQYLEYDPPMCTALPSEMQGFPSRGGLWTVFSPFRLAVNFFVWRRYTGQSPFPLSRLCQFVKSRFSWVAASEQGHHSYRTSGVPTA